MPYLYVIFDTNAYISLSRPSLDHLLARSQQHSVVGLASFWVAQELLAHVATQDDQRRFRRAWAAVRKLVAHCSHYDGHRNVVRFVGDSENTTSRVLFGRGVPDEYDNSEAYGALLGIIATADSPAVWRGSQAALDDIRTTVLTAERAFADHMWQSIIVALAPDAETWQALSKNPEMREALRTRFGSPASLRLAATALVDGMAARLGLTLDAARREATIQHALNVIPTPIHFLRAVAYKVAIDGYDLSLDRNANSLWDLQFAYSTSTQADINGSPLWAISADELLLKTARETNSSVFRDLANFVALLEQPTQLVLDELNAR